VKPPAVFPAVQVGDVVFANAPNHHWVGTLQAIDDDNTGSQICRVSRRDGLSGVAFELPGWWVPAKCVRPATPEEIAAHQLASLGNNL